MAYQTRPVRTPRQHIVVTEGTVMRTGLARADAQDDFDRALRRARWATLAGWLHGRSSSRLLVLGNERSSSARRTGTWLCRSTTSSDRWSRPGASTVISGPHRGCRERVSSDRRRHLLRSRHGPCSTSTNAVTSTTCWMGITVSRSPARSGSAGSWRTSPGSDENHRAAGLGSVSRGRLRGFIRAVRLAAQDTDANIGLCWPGGESMPCASRRLNARGRPTRPGVAAWQKIRPASTRYWPRPNRAHAAAPLPVQGRRCCLRSGSR